VFDSRPHGARLLCSAFFSPRLTRVSAPLRAVSQSGQRQLQDEPLQEQSPEPRGDAAPEGGGGRPAQEAETRTAGVGSSSFVFKSLVCGVRTSLMLLLLKRSFSRGGMWMFSMKKRPCLRVHWWTPTSALRQQWVSGFLFPLTCRQREAHAGPWSLLIWSSLFLLLFFFHPLCALRIVECVCVCVCCRKESSPETWWRCFSRTTKSFSSPRHRSSENYFLKVYVVYLQWLHTHTQTHVETNQCSHVVLPHFRAQPPNRWSHKHARSRRSVCGVLEVERQLHITGQCNVGNTRKKKNAPKKYNVAPDITRGQKMPLNLDNLTAFCCCSLLCVSYLYCLDYRGTHTQTKSIINNNQNK